MADLPHEAQEDLLLFASEIGVYVQRFPDWVAYRDDAEDISADDLASVEGAFAEIRDVIDTTDGVSGAVRDAFGDEVDQAFGEQAGEIEAKALFSSNREFMREVAEVELKARRNRRDLARKGGDFMDSVLNGPRGVPYHFAVRAEKPMRALADKFPTRLSWINAWYDAMFGKGDDQA
jgi:hypothetical protein